MEFYLRIGSRLAMNAPTYDLRLHCHDSKLCFVVYAGTEVFFIISPEIGKHKIAKD